VSAEASGGSSAELKQISVQVDALGDKFKKLVDDVSQKSKAIGDILSRQFADCGKQIDHASERQSEMISKGVEGFKNLATGIGDFSKSLATLGGVNAKVMEEVSKGLEPFKKMFETFEKGLALFGSVNEALKTMKELTAATSAGSNALDAGKSATGAVAAASGEGGKAAAAGAAGGAGLVTDGALASGATIAGVAVGVAAAGILVHDGLKTILNWTGILGGKFETLTGSVTGWYETVKRNDELEKKIEQNQEAWTIRAQKMKERQESERAYYEGRERIDESKKPLRDIRAMKMSMSTFRGRYLRANAGGQDEFDPARTTKQQLALQKQNEERHDRVGETKAFRDKTNKMRDEYDEARALANKTKVELDRQRLRARPKFPVEGEHVNGRITPAGQKKIDEAEEAAGVDRGIKESYYRPAMSLGVQATSGSSKLANQFDAALDAKRANDVNKALGPPPSERGPVDLQPLLSQHEHALKLATEIRDVEAERSKELLGQVHTMNQQVQAAKEGVVAARDHLKSEQERATAKRADLSMLTKGEQQTARDILHKLNSGKELTREEALTVKRLGLTQGDIGRKVNDSLAKGLDPGLLKEYQQAGGEEDLGKAQQELTDSTDRLKEAQDDASESFDNFMSELDEFANWANVVTSETKAVETISAHMSGHKDPNESPDGKPPAQQDGQPVKQQAAAIERAGDDVVAQVNQMGDAVVTQLGRVEAALGNAVQRIKQANA
jgi:hypothetical protein